MDRVFPEERRPHRSRPRPALLNTHWTPAPFSCPRKNGESGTTGDGRQAWSLIRGPADPVRLVPRPLFLTSRQTIRVLSGDPEGYRIAYSADGRLIAASSLGVSVRVWDAPPGGSSRSCRTGAGHTASPSARMAVASRRAATTTPSGYGTSPPCKRSASCAGTRTTCMPSPSAWTVRGWPRHRGT